MATHGFISRTIREELSLQELTPLINSFIDMLTSLYNSLLILKKSLASLNKSHPIPILHSFMPTIINHIDIFQWHEKEHAEGAVHLMKLRIFSSIFIFFLILQLVGCSTSANPKRDSSSLSKEQILRLTIPYSIKKFDSALTHDSFSLNILSNVSEGLMRLNQHHQPIPGLAEKVEVSPDQTVYTFTLRHSEWSDGKPVTAHDFEFAWKRLLSPATKSPEAYLFYPIVNAESFHEGEVRADKVGIDALDDRTLQIRLKRPVRNFLSLVALTEFSPVREDLLQDQGSQYGRDPTKMVFNGPFTISMVTDEGTVILTKSKRYWDHKNVHLQQVFFYVSNDLTRNMGLYLAGKIDTTRIDQEFVPAYMKSREFHSTQTSTTQYIRFNYKNQFFQNKKIRQAIHYAIDRERLVRIVKMGAEPAGGLIPPSMNGIKSSFQHEANIPEAKQDIAKAKKLFHEGLAELGLSEPPVSLVMLSCEDGQVELAIELKRQLREHLGLNILLNTTSRAAKRSLEQSGKFDIALSDWSATYPDPASLLETFTSRHPMNTGKYQDTPFDETIKRAVNSPFLDQQIKYLIQAEKFLVRNDQALIPLYYVKDLSLVKPYVKGLIRHPFGSTYSLKWVYIEKH